MQPRRSGVFLVVTVALVPSVGLAEPGRSELRLDPALDGSLLGAGLVLAGLTELLAQSGELAPAQAGSVTDVNDIDRWVAEGSTPGTDAPHHASNVLFGLALGASVLVPLSTGVLDGADAGWTDLVLVAEALSWNAAIANIVKLAVRRPRPLTYVQLAEGGFDANDTDGSLSFYSGHTSTVASAAAALTTIDFLRRPRGCPRPWALLVSGVLATVTTGAMRVAAKRHFPTDVAAGAVMGTAIGLAVPLLHRTRLPALPSVAVVPGGATMGLAGTL